jgi:hypothetical protein
MQKSHSAASCKSILVIYENAGQVRVFCEFLAFAVRSQWDWSMAEPPLTAFTILPAGGRIQVGAARTLLLMGYHARRPDDYTGRISIA